MARNRSKSRKSIVKKAGKPSKDPNLAPNKPGVKDTVTAETVDRQTPIEEKKAPAKKAPVEISRRERIVNDRAKCYSCAHALVEAIANSKQPEGSLVEVRRNLEGWMRQHETAR